MTDAQAKDLDPVQTFTIRRAAAHDALAIESLYRELVSDPHVHVDPVQVAALSESPANVLLAAEADGVICATALLTVCADVMYRTQPFGVVENVIVAESMRGRGIGRKLLARVEQMAVAADCTKLMLLSAASRQDAHEFFLRCGFNGDAKRALVKYRRQFFVA